MKVTISKRVLTVILIIALAFSAVNTYLIFDLRRALEHAARDATYDYIIFQDGNDYKAKNQASGYIEFTSHDAALVISQAITEGSTVYIKPGNYVLNSDIQMENRENAKLLGDGASIIGNGYRLIIRGDNWTLSKYNLVSDLKIVNSTIRIENSFGTTISNMIFEDCSKAIELANTDTWTEGTKIENSHFINCTEAIVFNTPSGNATGSYASTEITRCFFNIIDNSVGIKVESLAEVDDTHLRNIRMWMGENGQQSNQIGLLVEGTMFQTLLWGVVFESFATHPVNLFAIVIGETADPPPILSEGVSFLGNWTARVYNPFHKWIPGLGGVFSQKNLNIPVGINNQYGPTEDHSPASTYNC
jgi:hypothetical protein